MIRAPSTQPSSARPAPRLDFAPVALVAENDRPARKLLRDALELEHFRVLVAANGQEALELAESCMLDVLVTDVAMPRLDGFGLIRAIRRHYPGVPTIVTTGDASYGGRPLSAVAAELGVEVTLLKPFDLADLHRAVRAAVPLRTPGAPGSGSARARRASAPVP
jgi:CheY-like chemotaxis protein